MIVDEVENRREFLCVARTPMTADAAANPVGGALAMAVGSRSRREVQSLAEIERSNATIA